jgi:hypothetical protein
MRDTPKNVYIRYTWGNYRLIVTAQAEKKCPKKRRAWGACALHARLFFGFFLNG